MLLQKQNSNVSQSYGEIMFIFIVGKMRSSVSWMDGEADRSCYHLVSPAHGFDWEQRSIRHRNIDLGKRRRYTHEHRLSTCSSQAWLLPPLVLLQSHYLLALFSTQSALSLPLCSSCLLPAVLSPQSIISQLLVPFHFPSSSQSVSVPRP